MAEETKAGGVARGEVRWGEERRGEEKGFIILINFCLLELCMENVFWVTTDFHFLELWRMHLEHSTLFKFVVSTRWDVRRCPPSSSPHICTAWEPDAHSGQSNGVETLLTTKSPELRPENDSCTLNQPHLFFFKLGERRKNRGRVGRESYLSVCVCVCVCVCVFVVGTEGEKEKKCVLGSAQLTSTRINFRVFVGYPIWS